MFVIKCVSSYTSTDYYRKKMVEDVESCEEAMLCDRCVMLCDDQLAVVSCNYL